jgi:LPXTG-motif cell wall-anchored protein
MPLPTPRGAVAASRSVSREPGGGGAGARSRPAALVSLLLGLLGLVLAGQVAGAAPAAAHDYLVATNPAGGGAAATSPRQVSLTFNEAVNTRFAVVQVTGPSGGLWQDGGPHVLGTTVTQPLRPLGPAGPYRVTWRVVSADGHPVDGTFSFTLRTAGSGTPAPSAAQPAAPAAGTSSSSWLPLAGGLVAVALLLAAAAALLARRRGAGVDRG